MWCGDVHFKEDCVSTLDEIRGKVLTVNGLIDPADLGVTMMHEHVLISVNDEHFLSNPVIETAHCVQYVQAGGKTLVSMSNRGLRWDRPGAPPSPVPSFGRALQQIAAASGVNIVLGTGFYKQDWQRPEVLSLSIPELEQIIVDDILEGADGAQAGIIGEVGISDPGDSVTLPIFEWKSLVASCRAMFRTGAAILIHTDINTSAAVRHLALDICDRLGAPLSRIIVSHLRPQLPGELQQARDFMKRGALVCFDLIGHSEHSSGEDRAAAEGVATLISEGFLSSILLAEDIFDTQNFFGLVPPVGYAYLTDTFEGMLRANGVNDEEIAVMRVANARALTFSVPDSAAELLDLASVNDIAEVPDVTVSNGRNGRRFVQLDGGSLQAAIPKTVQPIVPFTASLFVRGTDITEAVCLVDSGLTEARAGATTWPESAARGWALRVGADGPEFCLGTGDGAILRAAGAADVFDDQWHHIAGVFDGMTAAVFVDGAPTGQSAGIVAIPVKAERGLAIGCSAADEEHFTGLLTEVTFLAEALDEEAIRAMSEDKPDEEPPPDGGEEPPPDDGGEPPPDGGEEPPPDDGGEPPPDGGEEPPPDGGEEPPPDDGGEPPPDGGEEPPPDGGEEPPPDGGEEPPPDDGGEPPPDGGEEPRRTAATPTGEEDTSQP
ncbi:MAG: phosphotriesterase-related protein [Thermoanaerobaculia bacterium]|nr:phosphotriesterase-related protein [Thermoanaerobaculia bacterium]